MITATSIIGEILLIVGCFVLGSAISVFLYVLATSK